MKDTCFFVNVRSHVEQSINRLGMDIKHKGSIEQGMIVNLKCLIYARSRFLKPTQAMSCNHMPSSWLILSQ